MLYKELNYQELYFSSYEELNDPMDLSARMDFTPTDEKLFSFLVWLVVKTTMQVTLDEITEQQKHINRNIIAFARGEALNKEVESEVFKCLKDENEKKRICLGVCGDGNSVRCIHKARYSYERGAVYK